MSEIGDRARERLSQMDLYLTYDGYLSSKDIDQILNIEELAVVDREAELPIILTEPQQSIAWNIRYLKDLIRKEGWVKEDKK